MIDGFRLGEMIHAGSMATIFRLAGPEGPLPLIMKIPRLGPGERAVNVIGFEVCRTVLGASRRVRHHPTLVAYGDVETTPYLVMEYIDGVRLDDWLDRAPMPPEEIARLGAAIALALHDLHRQDVVHLDLKPTNVLYPPERRSGPDRFRTRPSRPLSRSARRGAAHSASATGSTWRPSRCWACAAIRARDIYALGGMLYELATGRLPFGQPATVAELRRRLYRDPVPPRALVAGDARNGCRRSSCAASKSTPAIAMRPPRGRVRARRRRRRSRSPNAASRQRRAGLPTLARRRMRAATIRACALPAALDAAAGPAPIVAVAIAPQEADEALSRGAARRGAARDRRRPALPHRLRHRRAARGDAFRRAATRIPPPAATSGASSNLRRWAKPLELPEERVTYHVLESDKPAAALVDYATMNDVDADPDRRARQRRAPRGASPASGAQVVAERAVHRHGRPPAGGRLNSALAKEVR